MEIFTVRLFIRILPVLMSCFLFAAPVFSAESVLNTKKIEQLTGLKGKLDGKEDVFTVTLPRDDLKVSVAGVKMNPALGLTAWSAFTKVGEHTMVMGDLVMLAEQVNPVMSVALENGLEVTALHNHFFWDTPKIWFMHIGGTGNEDTLATAVGKTFNKLKATRDNPPSAPHSEIDPAKTSLDPKIIDEIIGQPGELKNGVYKVTIGRTTDMGGHQMGKAMGVNTWAAFAGSNDVAVVDGDFATEEDELQGVLKALRSAGIDIVAIHNIVFTRNTVNGSSGLTALRYPLRLQSKLDHPAGLYDSMKSEVPTDFIYE